MKKYYLTNGKEVEIGDTIHRESEISHPVLGKGVTTECVLITKKTLPKLIKAGIVTVKQDADKPALPADDKVPVELGFYIQKIANRLGWKIEKVCNYLTNVDAIFPAAAFSMILREIATEIDRKYKDHIENSPEIYSISMLDGRIIKLNKAHIKNYRNFAAFRSIDDAKIACKVTRDILKVLFKNGKQ